VAAFLIAAAASAQEGRRRPEMIPERPTSIVGRTAPEIEATLLDGQPFHLSSLRGRVVVVSFFASWCTPCRVELPALSELASRRPDVAIVAVNVDRDPDDARAFLAAVPVALPIVLDHSALALGRYGVVSMPTLFVLDPRGTVRYQKVGFNRETGIAELEQAIAESRR
jgi:thiol-disulfide isomerase/thioredoxin